MPFQTSVGGAMAPAVAGDFASKNPRATLLSGAAGIVAGTLGVVIGNFCWVTNQTLDTDNAGEVANSFGFGPVSGFIANEHQSVITTWLADSTLLVPAGLPVVPFVAGDFWVKNAGTAPAVVGQYAYANLSTGAVTFAAASSAATASGSASTVAASTLSVTGSIAGNVLTVTAVGSGSVVPGATIAGTGVASGTQIVTQLTGTTGGIGTYAVSLTEQAVASGTITGTYGTLTIGGTVAGTVTVGGLLSGTGVAAGTYITAPISGAGGAGTYAVNNNTVVASTAISATTNVQTKWVAQSAGAAGEPVKISSYALG